LIKQNIQSSQMKRHPLQIYNNREEDPALLKKIEEILLYRRGYLFNPPFKEDVILLASGGLDSSVTIDLIIREWNVRVHPLFIKRSARATPFEEKAFDYFINFYQKRFPNNLKKPYKIEVEIPPVKLKQYKRTNQLSVLGHPMRNAALQNVAAQYAAKLEATKGINIKTILTSTVADDSFPHSCLLALRVENLAICIDTGNWKMQITSPLIDNQLPDRPYFKKDLILYAEKYKIPLEKTRSCIEGAPNPDGTCNECLGRLRAFASAGRQDPIIYPYQIK